MTFTIDFNQLARVGKFVALLGFLLPWVTVSCSGTEILTATGVQLMTGDPQLAGPLEGMAESQREDAEPSIITIVAFAVAAIGLLVSLASRSRTAAAAMLATSLLAAGLSYFSIENMRQEMRRELTNETSQQQPEENPFFSAEQQQQMSQAMASSIRVVEEEGYYLTLVSLLLAALFALLTLFTRRAETSSTDA
ncbi:MAG TPA: hypothetical protein VEA80_02385 [Vitreimonas sp.]|uniref:hypothetical protein n=1 Tax=Vitreimonas sp. TaxID=3069702 RepID=UPI002D6281DE|nr:hypothetical protein [Vitreimonas sp.]HYD86298.1 hypothetical protein [Vitreimonas sp.]